MVNPLLEELGLTEDETPKEVTCFCGTPMTTDTPYFERVKTVVVPITCPECDLITLVKNQQEWRASTWN